jgi:hypothetical protein
LLLAAPLPRRIIMISNLERLRRSRITPVVSLTVIAAFAAANCGYEPASEPEVETKVGTLPTDGLHGFEILAGGSALLAVNAYGGPSDGGPLKLYQGCPWENPACTWTYRGGLIVSDADPNIGISTSATPTDGELLTQSARCGLAFPPASCKWIWRAGHLVSALNPNLAIYASGGAVHGADLILNKNCPNGKSLNCRWAFQSAMIGDYATGTKGTVDSLMYNAWGGATEGTVIRLADGCTRDNPDCTWTFTPDGMIRSDRDHGLALNAWGGAAVGTPLLLTGYCDPSNPDCRWRLENGALFSDVSNLAITPNAQSNGADMALANGCSSNSCRIDLKVGGPQCGQKDEIICGDGTCASGLTGINGICVPIENRTVRCPTQGSLQSGSIDGSLYVGVSNTGNWSVRGHAHNAGFFGANYTLGLVFDWADAAGEQFAFVHSGVVHGTLDAGSRSDDFTISGQDIRIIASGPDGTPNWNTLAQSPVTCNLHWSTDPWLVAEAAIFGLGLAAAGAILAIFGGQAANGNCHWHDNPNDPAYGTYTCDY